MTLLRPVSTQYKVTQWFGDNPQDYPSTHGHMGIDYGTPVGTQIVAAASGIVVWAGLDPETQRTPTAGYGVYVKLQHPGGAVTIYGHMTNELVHNGDNVVMGQPIGISGNTGRSTGPHLHFEYRPNGLVAADPSGLIVDEIPKAGGISKLVVTKQGAGLRLRLGPSINRGIVRSLKEGEVVEVIGFAGTDCWLLTPEGYVKFDPSWLKTV